MLHTCFLFFFFGALGKVSSSDFVVGITIIDRMNNLTLQVTALKRRKDEMRRKSIAKETEGAQANLGQLSAVHPSDVTEEADRDGHTNVVREVVGGFSGEFSEEI